MKKNIITIFAIALSFGVFAQQNDTMFIHMGKTILEIPTKDVDSITFYRTQPPTPSPIVHGCKKLQLGLDSDPITASSPSSALSRIPCSINMDNCSSCGECAAACPTEAIFQDSHGKYVIRSEDCLECCVCVDVCPNGAVVGCRCGNGGVITPPTKRCRKEYFEWGPIYVDGDWWSPISLMIQARGEDCKEDPQGGTPCANWCQFRESHNHGYTWTGWMTGHGCDSYGSCP